MSFRNTTRMQALPREQLLRRLFVDAIPRLWCPPLTHYDQRGAIDPVRMAAHLRHLSPYVRGFLIPGSTGDGWELTPAERRQVLAIGLEQAQRLDAQVLVGALDPDARQALHLIQQDLEWLKAHTSHSDAAKAMAKAHVCGFTICAPRGQHLSQEDIRQGLASVLELGVPTAIYQLPQVTLNELSAELTAALARRYQNFILFKDTSGSDRVALSGKGLGGVYTVRGAEGDYARWLKAAGGPYDGFLLSSANCLARELQQMITDLSAGRLDPARQLSQRLATAVSGIMDLAGDLPQGNPFANANKAIDHFFAHGPEAATLPPPRLHGGNSLSPELIRATGQILLREKLMPLRGYLR